MMNCFNNCAASLNMSWADPHNTNGNHLSLLAVSFYYHSDVQMPRLKPSGSWGESFPKFRGMASYFQLHLSAPFNTTGSEILNSDDPSLWEKSNLDWHKSKWLQTKVYIVFRARYKRNPNQLWKDKTPCPLWSWHWCEVKQFLGLPCDIWSLKPKRKLFKGQERALLLQGRYWKQSSKLHAHTSKTAQHAVCRLFYPEAATVTGVQCCDPTGNWTPNSWQPCAPLYGLEKNPEWRTQARSGAVEAAPFLVIQILCA